jgi:hypothetical protein
VFYLFRFGCSCPIFTIYPYPFLVMIRIDKIINIACSAMFLALAAFAILEALFGVNNSFYENGSLIFPWKIDSDLTEKRLLACICAFVFGCGVSCWGDVSKIRSGQKPSVAAVVNIASSAGSLAVSLLILAEMLGVYDSAFASVKSQGVFIALPVAKANPGMLVFVLCGMFTCSFVAALDDIRAIRGKK